MLAEGDNWEPQYRNDSRQWLSSDVNSKANWKTPTTVSKSIFIKPDPGTFHSIGSRKKLFQKFFLNEVQNELIEKMIAEPPISPYKTEYMGSFNKSDGPGKGKPCYDEEMEQRFPLYTNQPSLSFWHQNRSNIHGLTSPCDPKRIFHKNASFTKPIEEVLDDPFSRGSPKVSVYKWYQLRTQTGYDKNFQT